SARGARLFVRGGGGRERPSQRGVGAGQGGGCTIVAVTLGEGGGAGNDRYAPEDKNTSNLLRTSQGVHKLGAGACFSDVVPPKASDDLVQGEAQHAALSRQELLDDCLHAKRNVVREVGHVRADEAEDWVSFR
ncbi:unnamed protein product, partial [Prorocentrum cordatum]